MDILAEISLEDHTAQKSGWLYRSLMDWYRPYYDPDQRILVKCFEPISPTILENLASAVDLLDISRCFVRIVTDQESVIKWSSENPGFDLEIHEPVKTTSLIPDPGIKKDSLCAHAWAGFHLWPDGSASVCCDSSQKLLGSDEQELNIHENSLQEIYQSVTLKNIRSEMLQGKKPLECSKCWKSEQIGKPSKRHLSVYALGHVHGMIDWETDDNFYYIGGHLGNYCNLACRICSPDFSSKWVAEISGSAGQDRSSWKVFQKKRSWVLDQELFWKQIRELAPRLKAYELLGGEPLMLRENIDFLEWLGSHGYSKDSIFRITTNGTYLPGMLLDPTNYKRLEITFSIDDIGHRFEYQRYGAKWQEVCDNLKKISSTREIRKNIKIGINSVISAMNIFYLPELVKWVIESGTDHWHFSVLDSPAELSGRSLPSAVISEIIPKIQSIQHLHPDLPALSLMLSKMQCVESHTNKTLDYLTVTDQTRQQHYSDAHPEMFQLLESNRMPANLG